MSEHTCGTCKWHEPDKETGTGRSYCLSDKSAHCGEWTTDEWSCGAWEARPAPRPPTKGSIRERLLAGDWRGMTPKEIAQALGCSAGGVNSTLTRLRREGVEVPHVGTERKKGKRKAAAATLQGTETAGEPLEKFEQLAEPEPEYTKLPEGAAILGGDPEEGISELETSTRTQTTETAIDWETMNLEPGALLMPAETAATVAEDATVGRAECLARALDCVCGERETDYGTPEDSFGKIAALWSAYRGEDYTARDVAAMMALLKIARIGGGRATVDSWVDLAGYAACGCEITTREDDD